MREDQIGTAIENLSSDLFERFAIELLRRTEFPGLNPTSPSHDLGEDAHSEQTTVFLHDGKWVSPVVSKTAKWSKLAEDCDRCQETNRQIDIIVFVTAGDPRETTIQGWRQQISEQYGWHLEVRALRWLAPTASRPKHESLVDDYLHIPPPGEDFAHRIETEFSNHTQQALRHIHCLITGLSHPLPRPELAWIEEQIALQQPVTLTGEAGTGKSGIAGMLAEAATNRGLVVLLLDARSVASIADEAGLRQHLSLKAPVTSAVQRVGGCRGCRLIIDQLDSVAGQLSAQVLLDLAVACAGLQAVEVVVVSRKQEARESRLLDKLASQGFQEMTSHPLDESTVADVLDRIGILGASAEVVKLSRNLLNLELIAMIKRQVPGFDFSNLMDEVDLWDQYLDVLLKREEVGTSRATAEAIVAEAAKLARDALNSLDESLTLDHPMSFPQQRLVSWQILEIDDGRVGRFRHEQFRDFLYAWDATQRGAMPPTVLDEIHPHASRNVIVWMDRIYACSGSPKRQQFLKEAFNV